jgi:predicted RNase H-like HicB family nuclease
LVAIVALIHGKAPAFGVSFPDLPGCIGGGESLEACLASGRDSLDLHLEGMIEDGAAIPRFRDIDALRRNPDFAEDFADSVLVVAIEIPSLAAKQSVALDADLVREIDRAAERIGQSRADFLAAAAREKLGEVA